MKKGDAVIVHNQTGIPEYDKRGVIVAVVKPDQYLAEVKIPGKTSLPAYPGGVRNHRSYLVQIGTKPGLMWPRVANIELVP
jgi:hypothetical protein